MFARSFLVGIVAAHCAVALAQEVVGRPWRGSPGITRSIADITAEQARTPGRQPFSKTQEEEGPERDFLPENPFAMMGSRYGVGTGAESGGHASEAPRFSVGTNFELAAFPDANAWPPDTMGDVSPTQVLVCVNGRIRNFSRAGVQGSLNVDTDVFFSSVKTASNWFSTDPRVRWDPQSQRWFVVMIDATSSLSANRVMIAVSNSATITTSSSFTFFQFRHDLPSPAGDTGAFLDYPTMGVDKNAIYIAGNLFSPGFAGCSAFVVRKSSLLGTGPIVVTAFRGLISGNVGMYTPHGADNDDPNATTGWFIGVENSVFGQLTMRKVSDPAGSPTLGPNVSVNVLATSFPRRPRPLGSTRDVDALDDRLFVAKIQFNQITGTRTLWTGHSIRVNTAGVASNSGPQTGTRWYEIANLDTGPSLNQSGTVFDATNGENNFWMSSWAMTRQGHAVAGFSSGGPAQRTGISWAERLRSDALGTTRPVQNVQISAADYNDQSGLTTQRWGDYSHTVVDPADGMSVWTFQMIAKTNTQWAVRAVRLLGPPPATPVSANPNNAAAGQSVSVTVDATSSNGSGFFDGGIGFANRLAVSLGTGITVSNIQFASPLQVTFTAALAANASPGPRSLTITNPDGQNVTLTNAFTVNSSLSVSTVSVPPEIDSNGTGTGTVTLSNPAPVGGAIVTLSRDNTDLLIPASVTVPSGATSADFAISAFAVNEPTTVTVTASFNGTATDTIIINAPKLTSVALTKTSVVGGSSTLVRYRVNIDQPAPTGGMLIPIESGDPDKVTAPASANIPAGATFILVDLTTHSVPTSTAVEIRSTWQATTKMATLTLLPPSATAVTLSPDTVTGGSFTAVMATVTIDVPAPPGGYQVETTSGNTTYATVPATVTIPEGETSGSIPVTHFRTFIVRDVTIFADPNGVRVFDKLRLTTSEISSITLAPKVLVGGLGTVITGKVTLRAVAPSGGVTVPITVSDPGVVTLSAPSVTVPAGKRAANFTATATAVGAVQNVIVTATFNGPWEALLTVNPPTLQSISTNRTSVVGGSATNVQVKLVISSPSPVGGLVVSLSSSNAAAATLPATLTIPAGATQATVNLTHFAVGADVDVTLSATFNGVTRTTVVTIRKP